MPRAEHVVAAMTAGGLGLLVAGLLLPARETARGLVTVEVGAPVPLVVAAVVAALMLVGLALWLEAPWCAASAASAGAGSAVTALLWTLAHPSSDVSTPGPGTVALAAGSAVLAVAAASAIVVTARGGR